jgi:uncharacterized protein (DUF2342 family)
MLQIIAFGVAFLLFGMGAIARLLKVLATPLEKRKASTGMAEQLFYTLLGLAILALAYFQGAELAAKMNGFGF